MKALVSLILLLLVGGGGYYVFFVLPEQAGEPVTRTEPSEGPVQGSSAAKQESGELKAKQVPAAKEVETDDKAKRRELWAKLRPACERLIPDPDNVGPCPPVDRGGRPQPVIQRYLDPANGFAVWVHDDGSYTYLHPTGGYLDKNTGKTAPLGEMVTTLVPTEPKPIHPGELPPETAAKSESKESKRGNERK